MNGESLGNRDKVAVRGQLELDPTQAANFRLDTYWAEDKSQEVGLHLIAAYKPYNAGRGGPTLPADSDPHDTGWRLDPVFAGVTGLGPDSKPGLDNENYGVNFTAKIDFGGARLTAITAWNKMIRREYSNWDATEYYDSDKYLRSYLKVISQEMRIASKGAQSAFVGRGFLFGSKSRGEFLFGLLGRRHRLPAGTTPDIVRPRVWTETRTPFGEFGQIDYKSQRSVSRSVLGVARGP